MNFDTFIKSELENLKQNNLYRELTTLDVPSANWVEISNNMYINLSSNNYLNYAGNTVIKDAAIIAIQDYGIGSTGSRLITGTSTLHIKLEELVAEFKGTEKAIVYSCGYVANVSTIAAIAGPDDLILSDELNHASIIDGIKLSKANKLIYKHNDMTDLEEKLKQYSKKYNKCILITDTIFSMDGDIANMQAIVALKEKYNFTIMVDEAHATGIIGNKGAGIVSHYGLTDKIDIQMGTFSKALGVEGAYVAASEEIINFLINKSRGFIYSTASSPAVIGAVIAAIKLVMQDDKAREKLWWNVEYFKSKLKDIEKEGKISVVADQSPIFCLKAGDIVQTEKFQNYLLEEHNLYTKAIRPPTVESPRIRMCLNTNLSRSDLELILKAIKNYS